MVYNDIRDMLQTIKEMSGNIFIAGAGRIGKMYGEYLNRHNIPWLGFLDKNVIEGRFLCNKNVYPYECVQGNGCAKVIVSSSSYASEIVERLINIGLTKNQLIIPLNQRFSFEFIFGDEFFTQLLRVRRFSQAHNGERCFIIGNGPSLKIEDLEKLKKEVTFASNSIYALYNKTDWRPTYYGITDSLMPKMLLSENKIKDVLDGCKAMFSGIIEYNCLSTSDVEGKIYYFYSWSGLKDKEDMLFSDDVEKVLYTGWTVTYVLLQLAVYMGVKEIYLLGVDFSYSVEKFGDKIKLRNVINHNSIIEEEEKKWYPIISDRVGFDYLAEIDKQLLCYQSAKSYADAHGIKIYNATRGGKLEIFERVDFDSLF